MPRAATQPKDFLAVTSATARPVQGSRRQYASYTALQLRAWQRGFRRNSPEAMALFAKKLDDKEIAAVAAFYQQARGSAGAAVSK